MTRYHFEIVDGHKIEDPTGIEVASEIAKQIAIDEDDDDMKVVVKTSAGEVVHKTPIKPDSNT